jgi:hypothetical protein
LEAEDPQQYRAILGKLLIKAQEEDDENIVSNHYLQIKAILEVSLEEQQVATVAPSKSSPLARPSTSVPTTSIFKSQRTGEVSIAPME